MNKPVRLIINESGSKSRDGGISILGGPSRPGLYEADGAVYDIRWPTKSRGWRKHLRQTKRTQKAASWAQRRRGAAEMIRCGVAL